MLKFHVPDMGCEGCVSAIDRAVRKVDPGAEIKAELGAKLVEIQSALPQAALQEALKKAGFPASVQGNA